jgi:hypothetical protein
MFDKMKGFVLRVLIMGFTIVLLAQPGTTASPNSKRR